MKGGQDEKDEIKARRNVCGCRGDGAMRDRFLSLVRRFTDITELTHELAATFINRIIVGKLERIDGKKHQRVRIVYNIIGEVGAIE